MLVGIGLALAPVAGLIVLGFGIRRTGFLAEAFWPQAERLSYFVLLPALLMQSLAVADLTHVPVARFALALVVPLTAAAGLLLLLKPRNAADGPAFTSVFQGGIRFNNFVALTMAGSLYGAPGIALAALANAFVIPTVNLLCVAVFAWASGARVTPLGMLRAVALNPLILACAAGGLLKATGLALPAGIEPAVRALGQAALPLGLLCVGAAIDPGSLGRGLGLAGGSCAAKFVALPLASALCCAGLGVTGPAAGIALLFAAMPTAPSAYILARQLGGDAPLMAGIIALQTLLAALTVPAVLMLAGSSLP